MIEQRIALAIQKPNDGVPDYNLGDESVALLKAGGLLFSFKPRVDDIPTNIPGLDIVRMKNADLPKVVAQEDADLVIVGSDMYNEYVSQKAPIPIPKILKRLSISRCSLQLGVKNDFNYTDPRNLAGLRIATSYPNVTAYFFERWKTNVQIRTYQGGEEGIVKRGKADACVVISKSGITFAANGLKSACEVLDSQAMLIANPKLSENKGSEQIVWRALRTIMTGIWKTQYKMLEANFLTPLTDKVLATLPGAKSPTVSSLQSGGQATRSLVPVSELDESLSKLYAAGASEIVALEVQSVYPNLDDLEITRMMRVIYGKDWQLSDLPHPI